MGLRPSYHYGSRIAVLLDILHIGFPYTFSFENIDHRLQSCSYHV
jgi:hypothetical protein